MTGGSQGDNDREESRFKYLLQPIKDLAENWNIDISRELEDYLGELSEISFAFEGEHKTFNFAEAALLIQGSATVYSRKVDFLHDLLYQTLDLIRQKKESSLEKNGGIDKDVNFDTEPEFLTLDDNIELEEGKGIDLRDTDIGYDSDDDDNEEENGGGNRGRGKNKNKQQALANQPQQQENSSNNNLITLPNYPNAFLSTIVNSTMGQLNDDGSRKNDVRMNMSQVSLSGGLFMSNNAAMFQSGLLGIPKPIDGLNASDVLAIGSMDILNRMDKSAGGDTVTTKDGQSQQQAEDDDDDDDDREEMNYHGGDSDDDDPEKDKEKEKEGESENKSTNESKEGEENPDKEKEKEQEQQGEKEKVVEEEEEKKFIQEDKDDDDDEDLKKKQEQVEKEREQQEREQQQKKKKKIINNPWILLDPHEEDSKSEKPFKKGKTFNIPLELQDESKRKKKKSDDQLLLKKEENDKLFQFSNEPIFICPTSSLSLRGCYFKDLSYIYTKFVNQNRSFARKNQSSDDGDDSENQLVPYQDEDRLDPDQLITDENGMVDDGFDVQAAQAGFNDDDDDDDDNDFGGDNDGGGEGLEINNNNLDQDNMMFPSFENTDMGGVGNEDGFGGEDVNYQFENNNAYVPTQSYEDMCKSHVEKYLASAEQYIKETALMQRINDWNKKLSPLLEEQSAHPSFDIHDYGTRFLRNMNRIVKRRNKTSKVDDAQDQEEEVEEEVEEEGGDIPEISNDDKQVLVSFKDMTEGLPTYEICRRFTSCLQLANNGNVEIVSNHTVNNLNFHLLSLVPKYDIEGLKVPSMHKEEDYEEKDEGLLDEEDHQELEESFSLDNNSSSNKKKIKTNTTKRKKNKQNDQDEDEDEKPVKKPKKPSTSRNQKSTIKKSNNTTSNSSKNKKSSTKKKKKDTDTEESEHSEVSSSSSSSSE
eukprot:gene3974-4970_t